MTTNTLTRVNEALKHYPPLPTIVERLCELVDNPRSDIETVAKLLGSDPSLTSRLLKLANSSFYGSAKAVSSVPQAIIKLGGFTVKNLALSSAILALKQPTQPSESALTQDSLWQHAFITATVYKSLAKKHACLDPEEAFTLGLLHNIGKSILLQAFGEEYANLVCKADTQNLSLVQAESDHFHINHQDVTDMLCEKIKVPSRVMTAFHKRWQNNTSIESSLFSLSILAANLGQYGYAGDSAIALSAVPSLLGDARTYETVSSLPEQLALAELIFGATVMDSTVKAVTELSPIDLDCDNPTLFQLAFTILLSLGYKADSGLDSDKRISIHLSDALDTPNPTMVNIRHLKHWIKESL